MRYGDWQLQQRLATVVHSYAERGEHAELIPHNVNTFQAADAAQGSGVGQIDNPWPADTPELFRIEPTRDYPWIWIGNTAFRIAATNTAHMRPRHDKMVRITIHASGRMLGNGHARNSSTGADFGFGWIPLLTLWGSGFNPHLWPYPIFFAKQQTLSMEFVNIGSSDGRRLSWTLLGYKLMLSPLRR